MQGICRSSWTLCLYEIENEVIKFRCEKKNRSCTITDAAGTIFYIGSNEIYMINPVLSLLLQQNLTHIAATRYVTP